jgi:hypothetical protein
VVLELRGQPVGNDDDHYYVADDIIGCFGNIDRNDGNGTRDASSFGEVASICGRAFQAVATEARWPGTDGGVAW